ncbi:MAG TPA: sugar transferase [Candidatus Saccharibacteria bacterium]|nr:sugar transferase [Candidatus Saccharibacteria bacterium]
MKNNASFLYGLFLIIADVVSLISAFVLAFIFRVSLTDKPIINPVPSRTYFGILIILIPFWVIIFALIGLYTRNIYENRFSELGRLFVGSTIGTLFVVGVDFFGSQPIFPAKLVPVYGFLLTFTILVIMRNLVRLVRRILFSYNKGISNVLIVGHNEATNELVDWLSDPKKSGYKIVGIVGEDKNTSYPPEVKTYKDFNSATKSIGANNIHSIMQTELYKDSENNNEVLTFAQNNHIAYRFIPGNSELFVGNMDVELFQSSIPMIAIHQTALIGWGRIAKRIFDLLVSFIFIILLSPIYLLCALAIFIFDPGSVIFKQKRVTRYNTKFTIYKFRTHKKKFSGLSPEQAFKKMGKPELAIKYRENGDQLDHDPRVTKVGRFLRSTSLDELPQLFNVLKGDISLVGPRALVPEEIEEAKAKNNIVSVKSGITGFAQISGRKDIPPEERRKLDLYYVQNWSFWLDIVILIKTLRVLINVRSS